MTTPTTVSINAAGETKSVKTPAFNVAFTKQDRTLLLDSAMPPGAPPTATGRTVVAPFVTYDPVTRTWSWRQ